MDRASQIIFDEYFVPTKKRNYEYIGMEFECPIYPNETGLSLREIGDKYLSYLIQDRGCTIAQKGNDGYLVKVRHDGDSISFDLHYHVIEFSIKPCTNLVEIKNRFSEYLLDAKNFYQAYDCKIEGFGNYFPYKDQDDLSNKFPKKLKAEYTNDDFYRMVQRLYKEGFGFEEGLLYTINMCSIQTHLDIPFDCMTKTFNLLNELTFVRGLLFSNSPWISEEGVYYCNRDNAWMSCGVPNTGIFDKHFENVEDICEEMSKEMHFLKINEQGKPDYFDMVTLKDYYNDGKNDPEDLQFFRSFKNVVVNSYNCVEIREDCTQPFTDIMVTGAFNLGMALGYEQAAKELGVFKEKARITGVPNSTLRLKSITGKLDIDEDLMRTFLTELYDIAYYELEKRGYGEQEFLYPLKSRIERLECPAKVFLEKQKRNSL